MSFGFPAYSTSEVSLQGKPPEEVQRLIRTAIGALGWHIKRDDTSRVVAAASVSLWSWGEKIIVECLSEHDVRITSKCALPTQCVDWGKNARNVTRFVDYLQAHASSTATAV